MTFIKKIKDSIVKEESLFESEDSSRGIFTFINSYSYLVIRKEKSILDDFDGVFFDGLLIVVFINLFLNKKVKRVSFDMTSLAPKVFKYAIDNKKTIYFLGSKEEEIKGFVNVIKQNFPGINIEGYRSGYFSVEERKEVLKGLVQSNPDILVVGMGTPLQEVFLADLVARGWKGLGFTCGGFIHQTSDSLYYYPKWIDRFHLRWLYRLYDEPKLIKRFLKSYIGFPIIFTIDFCKYYFSNKLS